MLQQVASLLVNEFRHSDVVARLGGDEFCVLFTGSDKSEIERPLQNLQEDIKRTFKDKPYDVGYSVGIVDYAKDRHESIQELLAEADQRMYEQKASRR